MSISKQTDEWFFKTRAVKPKDDGMSVSGGSRNRPPPKRGSGLTNIKAAAKKHPEVMVKIPKRHSKNSKGMAGIRNHIDYVSRNGKIELENQDGEILKGKQAVKSQADTWKKSDIPEHSRRREALNIVLSMPPGTPPHAVKNAAREFAAEQFDGHQYVFALHHESEKEGEPPHPHVHLCVLIKSDTGRRLNPNKNDLFEWRVRFAEKLRDEGIQCAATRRQHRGQTQKAENSIVRAIRQRGGTSRTAQSQAKDLMQAVAQSTRPPHPYLADALSTRAAIAGKYAEIAESLAKAGERQDAELIAGFAREIAAKNFTTRAQAAYDEIMAVRLPLHQTNDRQHSSLKNDNEIER